MYIKIMHLGRCLEAHTSVKDAERAFWVITAHELKNGRVANVSFEGMPASATGLTPPSQIDLAPWAVEALKAADAYS